MDLSIIIPLFDAEHVVARQMEALAQQDHQGPWELIVADNGSRDRSVQVVEAYRNRIQNLRIIDASGKRGRCYARNLGAAVACSDNLAFCDDDDVVDRSWVRLMVAALAEHDFVSGYCDLTKLNPKWLYERLGYPETKLQRHKLPPHLLHAAGSNLGIKRRHHQAIGGFDESLLLAWEDTDYAWRLQWIGVTPVFVREAVVYYRYSSKLKDVFRKGRIYAHGNVMLYKKYQAMAKTSESWYFLAWQWVRLLPRLRHIRRKGDLVVWLWQCGWRIGHLEGCLKHHVHAPSKYL